MNRLFRAAVALLCAFGFGATAHAQLTTVTASHIYMGGVPIASGMVTFTPVSTQGQPIAFAQGGGGLNGPMAFPCSVTAGALGDSCQVPDACLTTPANIRYLVQVINRANNAVFTLQQVPNICGTTWPLDAYGPPSQNNDIQTLQSSYGVGAPPSPCISPSIYIQNALGGKLYICVDGVPVLVSGGGGAPTAIAGATADYDFLQGSGTTVSDITGNGNNGTLLSGAQAPVWAAKGLSFSSTSPFQAVQLPAALNTACTFEAAVYIQPLVNQAFLLANPNQFPVLVTSSLGDPGANLTYQPNQIVGLYRPSVYSGGAFNTQSNQTVSGFHVITWVLGTDTDHVYIDGVEYPYAVQFPHCGLQTSGNYFLGSSGVAPFNQSGFLGTFYRFVAIPGQLSAARVAADAGQIRAEVAARGVTVEPQRLPQTAPVINAIGDSITCGLQVTAGGCDPNTAWPNTLSLAGPSFSVVNWGISGVTVQALAVSESNRVAPRCTSSSGSSYAIVFAGTNDLTGFTAQVTVQALASEVKILKTAGCTVFVGTMLSRGGSAGSPISQTLDQQKDSYDALVLSQWKLMGAEGVVDFAANPLLGADDAYSNPTYFQADQTHPTVLGQSLLGIAASNALNYYFGATISSPNVVTATTYQMLSSDGAITAAPTANATYTAPDCTGPSGADYVISNPQSAFTVSIVGEANQPINGLSTPIVIPSNGTVTLHDVPNPKTVSGCHWVM